MESKTKIDAEEGKQELFITRAFELPVALLFKAYTEPEFLEQWMGTKVLKLESKKHGSYQFETTDPMGGKHLFNGAIHTFIPNEKIIRTFEMENTPIGVQLEIYTFESINEDNSKLSMQVIYESLAKRDLHLTMPFAQGINMAHNRIQEILKKM